MAIVESEHKFNGLIWFFRLVTPEMHKYEFFKICSFALTLNVMLQFQFLSKISWAFVLEDRMIVNDWIIFDPGSHLKQYYIES